MWDCHSEVLAFFRPIYDQLITSSPKKDEERKQNEFRARKKERN